MIKTKKQMFVMIGAYVLFILLGTVTYAFFNYTKTGAANTISTGRIAFNAEQNGVVTLSDLFPIQTTGTITSSTPGVGSLSIHVTGDTNYEEGIEYLVKAVNVTSSSNGKELPISIQISYTANTGKSIGEADDDYYDNRGGNTSVYKLLTTDKIENNGDIVVGYIAPGQTGIDGYITILAYLDANNIAITDTIEGGDIEVAGYDNGTTSTWIDGRTVFTTEEWNELQENGVSFQIKVESQDGIWVTEPEPPALPTAAEVIGALDELETTPYGKVYSGADPNNYVIFNNEQWRIIGVYTDEVNGDMLKIVRPTALNSVPYNVSGSLWDNSSAQQYLLNVYYESLPDDTKNMIYDNGVWNVGVGNDSTASAATMYSDALTTSTVGGVTYTTPWIGKVGLIAGYEYMYAAENDGICWTTAGSSYYSCRTKNWLGITLTNNFNSDAWTITPFSSFSGPILYIGNNGYMSHEDASQYHNVMPVVYLKPNVTITGGTGEYGNNAYTLSYTAN